MVDIGYGPSGRTRDRNWAMAVYIMYLVGSGAAFFLFAGAVAALIRAPASGSLWRSHFRFQQRGFVLMALAALGLVALGFLAFAIADGRIFLLNVLWGALSFLVFCWWVARNVVGLLRAADDKPVPNPRSTMFGN